MFLGVVNLPNVITLLGLSLAVTGCFLALQQKLEWAIICLMYAGLCDVFDGAVARKFNLSEEEQSFGAQLDSLVDIVSFGITPVIIAMGFGFHQFWAHLIFLFYAVCATMRLAYFNIHGTTLKGTISYYTGLPVTCAALIFPVVFAWMYTIPYAIASLVVPLVFLGVSILFILKIPIPKPKGIFYLICVAMAAGLTYYWLTHPIALSIFT